MKKFVVATKTWYVAHERPILYTSLAIAITAVVLMRGGLAEHDQFLKHHGLYEEFYNAVD